MTRKELKYVKECYDRMFAGTYDPQELQKAYELITSVTTPVKLSIKKNTIYSFMNYQYSSLVAQQESGSEMLASGNTENLIKNEKVLTKKTRGRKKTVQKYAKRK